MKKFIVATQACLGCLQDLGQGHGVDLGFHINTFSREPPIHFFLLGAGLIVHLFLHYLQFLCFSYNDITAYSILLLSQTEENIFRENVWQWIESNVKNPAALKK